MLPILSQPASLDPAAGSAPAASGGATAAQRLQLRTVLERRREDLARSVQQIQGGLSRVEHAADLLAQDGDDAPQRDVDREVDQARNDMALRALGEVDSALGRLDEPGFGLCVDCGGPIAFARLRIEPWVRRCVICQGRAEAR